MLFLFFNISKSVSSSTSPFSITSITLLTELLPDLYESCCKQWSCYNPILSRNNSVRRYLSFSKIAFLPINISFLRTIF